MASVIQSIKNTQKSLRTGLRSGVPASVKNTQKSLRQGLGLTARLPVLKAPVGSIRGTRGTVNALDFTDEDSLNGLV